MLSRKRLVALCFLLSAVAVDFYRGCAVRSQVRLLLPVAVQVFGAVRGPEFPLLPRDWPNVGAGCTPVRDLCPRDFALRVILESTYLSKWKVLLMDGWPGRLHCTRTVS